MSRAKLLAVLLALNPALLSAGPLYSPKPLYMPFGSLPLFQVVVSGQSGVTSAGTNTFTGTNTFQDSKFSIVDVTDATKALAFDTTNVTTANTISVDLSGTAVSPALGVFGTTSSLLESKATTNTGRGQVRVQSDGSLTAYGVLEQWGTSSATTIFGLTMAGFTSLTTAGNSSAGLLIGTNTADPVIVGANNVQRLYIEDTAKTLVDNTIATFATMALGDDTGGGGTIKYCVYASDATTAAAECGSVDYAGVDVTAGAGGEVCPTPTKVGTPLQALSGATLTVTFAAATGTDICSLRVTADPNIVTPTTLTITWTAVNSGRVITPQ